MHIKMKLAAVASTTDAISPSPLPALQTLRESLEKAITAEKTELLQLGSKGKDIQKTPSGAFKIGSLTYLPTMGEKGKGPQQKFERVTLSNSSISADKRTVTLYTDNGVKLKSPITYTYTNWTQHENGHESADTLVIHDPNTNTTLTYTGNVWLQGPELNQQNTLIEADTLEFDGDLRHFDVPPSPFMPPTQSAKSSATAIGLEQVGDISVSEGGSWKANETTFTYGQGYPIDRLTGVEFDHTTHIIKAANRRITMPGRDGHVTTYDYTTWQESGDGTQSGKILTVTQIEPDRQTTYEYRGLWQSDKSGGQQGKTLIITVHIPKDGSAETVTYTNWRLEEGGTLNYESIITSGESTVDSEPAIAANALLGGANAEPATPLSPNLTRATTSARLQEHSPLSPSKPSPKRSMLWSPSDSEGDDSPQKGTGPSPLPSPLRKLMTANTGADGSTMYTVNWELHLKQLDGKSSA